MCRARGSTGQGIVKIAAHNGFKVAVGVAFHGGFGLALGSENRSQDGIVGNGILGRNIQIALGLLDAKGVKKIVQHGPAIGIKHNALDCAQAMKFAGHVQIALEHGQLVIDHAGCCNKFGSAKGAHILNISRGKHIGLGQVCGGKAFELAPYGIPEIFGR